MPQTQSHKWISTFLTLEQFETFILPHLHVGSRGPQLKLSLHAIFNYILRFLHTGCQWKQLLIEKDKNGQPEIHHSSIYRAFRRFETYGCFENIFKASVSVLHEKGHLDPSVIHGDGTTTAAKKGVAILGFSGHKHIKGDKVVAFCDGQRPTFGHRNCNIISPFVTAPGNRNESPLFKTALSTSDEIVESIARPFSIGIWFRTSMNIFGVERLPNEDPKDSSIHPSIFQERFCTIERVFTWEDKFKRLLLRFERISGLHYALKSLAYTMMNLRHFCQGSIDLKSNHSRGL